MYRCLFASPFPDRPQRLVRLNHLLHIQMLFPKGRGGGGGGEGEVSILYLWVYREKRKKFPCIPFYSQIQ